MLCEDNELDWTKGPVKILRVSFTINVYDLWDFNSVEILKQWSKGKRILFWLY